MTVHTIAPEPDNVHFDFFGAEARLMIERYGVDRVQALALASLVVDVRITQLVNGVVGAHAVLADDAIG